MKCPHCGFRHLTPVTHCARCKKPMPEGTPEDYSPSLFDDPNPKPEATEMPKPAEPVIPPKAPARPAAIKPETPAPPIKPIAAPAAPKPRDPMEYDPDLSLARSSTLPAEEISDEITAVLDGDPEQTAVELDPNAAADDALLHELESSQATVIEPEPPPAAPPPPPALPKPPAMTEPIARPATVAPAGPSYEREQSRPGSGDSIAIEDVRNASKSDWSEGRRLDTFFGTPPDQLSGPAATPAPDLDLSVIRIRPDDDDEPSSPATPVPHSAPPTMTAPTRPIRPTPPVPADPTPATPVPARPTPPPPAAKASPEISVARPASPDPQPRHNEPPPGEESMAPSFLTRDPSQAKPSMLPFGDRSGSTGEASVYGTRSLTGPKPDPGPLGRRALAGAVDFGLVGGASYLLVRAALWVASRGEVYGSLQEWVMLIGLPALLIAALLSVVFQTTFLLLAGKTPGMGLAGLSFPGGRPATVRIVLRSLTLTAMVLPLGLGLLLAYRGGGLWIHDLIAGVRPARRER